MYKFLCINFFILFTSVNLFSQACLYDKSSSSTVELCESFLNGESIEFDKNAESAVDMIISTIGISKRFIISECNGISNCVAVTYKGKRFILYDKFFINEIVSKSNSWASLSILAHEIGHHVNGHSLDLLVFATDVVKTPSLYESRVME